LRSGVCPARARRSWRRFRLEVQAASRVV
jgi:hypothetical protein